MKFICGNCKGLIREANSSRNYKSWQAHKACGHETLFGDAFAPNDPVALEVKAIATDPNDLSKGQAPPPGRPIQTTAPKVEGPKATPPARPVTPSVAGKPQPAPTAPKSTTATVQNTAMVQPPKPATPEPAVPAAAPAVTEAPKAGK